MTLQLHPIVLGCMIVVAVGTVIYSLVSRPQPQPHNTDNSWAYRQGRIHSSYSSMSSLNPDESEESQKKRKADYCSICLSSLTKRLKKLTCGHVFHYNCITTWFNTTNKTCPVCRREESQ